ncbi:type II toxin-antitoxin system VapC family toxin [Algiphilus sp.]|uniref:type II toxin-antitoxin system VapC family toxin n=1 Tax=Algiphilus sp. TaxID=1872431 RepID=UPI003BA87D53
MKQIAIDSHLLIWGMKEESEPGQEDMIPTTKAFFEHCKQKNIEILVPAVVVGELLTAIEPKHHPIVLNLLQSSFVVPPYDAAAAAIFARLWRDRKESGQVKKIQVELQATRQELKADCMIVATALAQKAEAIYSHDAKLKAFANGAISVHEVPRIQVQHNLALADG